jgi:hypothetical protein
MTVSNTASGKLKIEDHAFRLRRIQAGFERNLTNLHSQLELLDSEPALQSSLNCLKREAEARAQSLEVEVKALQEELKSIKELLGLNIKNNK